MFDFMDIPGSFLFRGTLSSVSVPEMLHQLSDCDSRSNALATRSGEGFVSSSQKLTRPIPDIPNIRALSSENQHLDPFRG
jgi:hypothetical protein